MNRVRGLVADIRHISGVWAMVVTFGVMGCSSTRATRLSATGARPTAVVDAKGRPNAAAFFRKPVVSHLRISPNGRSIAGIFSQNGEDRLVVYPLGAGEPQGLATLDRNQNKAESWTVRGLGWGSSERILVSMSRPSPKQLGMNFRQTRLLVVDVPSNEARYLGERWYSQEHSQGQDDVLSYLPEDPEAVLIRLWLPGDKGAGTYRVDLGSGKLQSIAKPSRGIRRWVVDHRHQVRVGWGEARWESQDFLVARTGSEDAFEEILRWNPYQDEDGFAFAGFSPAPHKIYVYAPSEAGRRAVYSYDLASRSLGELIFSHPEVDVSGISSSKVDGRLLSISYVTDKPRLHFVDAEWERRQRMMDEALPGRENRIVDSDSTEQRFLVMSSSDLVPPTYYLLDAAKGEMTLLFNAYPELMRAKLAPMETIRYQARDGLTIEGYLTQPVTEEFRAPYPLIVLPHGGPWARDVWGWDAGVQFLASRGFAVLQPNFRGSSGYGEDFNHRGYGRWGLEMQDDLTDAALWAVAQGIADRERIGIYGANYGGYAALRALQTDPDVFKAGASLAGVTDLLMLLDDGAHHYGLLDDIEALVGKRWSDRQRLQEASPARGADHIQAPVLIAHGTEDPRVLVDHATRMTQALERAGGSVHTYLYEGEVHGFIDERNKIDFYTKLAGFFERNLGRSTFPPAAPEKSAAGLDATVAGSSGNVSATHTVDSSGNVSERLRDKSARVQDTMVVDSSDNVSNLLTVDSSGEDPNPTVVDSADEVSKLRR